MTGVAWNLSGLMYCADCGNKMRLNYNNTTNSSKKNPQRYFHHNYTCGSYSRSGKLACSSHYIKFKDIEAIVLADIRSLAELTVDEDVQELTREMCIELIEYITVDELVRYNNAPSDIHIYYKLLDKPLKDKRNLFIDEI